MKKISFLIIILIFSIDFIQTETINNPIYLNSKSYPFVLYADSTYYYIITSEESLKLNKENGDILDRKNTMVYTEDFIYCIESSNYNYIYTNKEFYKIDINSFISLEKITDSNYLSNENSQISYKCCIKRDNYFIIHGIKDEYLYSSKISHNNQYHSSFRISDNIIRDISCKQLKNDKDICLFKFDNNVFFHEIYYPQDNFNFDRTNTLEYDSTAVNSIALYDTKKMMEKISCLFKNRNVYCNLIKFYYESGYNNGVLWDFLRMNKLDNPNLNFNSNDFSERDCSSLSLSNELLFCCGILNYIKCSRLDPNNYELIKYFSLSIEGKNSYLSFKNSDNYIALFYMNEYSGSYEYIIYYPKCPNIDIIILNSIKENNSEEEREILNEFLGIKTNKYYIEFKTFPPDNIGYLELNNVKINSNTGKKFVGNNDINVVITGNGESEFTINYVISVQNDEVFTAECETKIILKLCYISCKKCTKSREQSSSTNHNCKENQCIENYYPSPDIKTNCFKENEKEINWYLDRTNSEFKFCNDECKSCSGSTNQDCLSCYNNFKLYKGKCIEDCPTNTFMKEIDNQKYCIDCYKNCKTCNKNLDYNNMGCIECKNDCIFVESKILNEGYCFKIINYGKTKITFDIHELYLLNDRIIEESCLYFNKTIFYNQYKCITKPKKTYYIINDEIDNTGVIDYCDQACDTCIGKNEINDTNCINCVDNYFKTEDSNTNCILESLIPKNYYKNKTNNIFYKCYKTCSSCNNSIQINMETNEKNHNCIECIPDYYFLYETNNCYNESILEQGYYFLKNDSMYHKCDIQCETCFNSYEINNTNCIKCNMQDGYYNSIDEISSNCYNNESIKQGHYLNTDISPFIWEKCHERCEKCTEGSNITNMNCLSCKSNLINIKTNKSYFFNYTNGNCIETCPDKKLITPIGDCVYICPSGTYEFALNFSCVKNCPNNYEINKQRNKCILKVFDEVKVSEFKNKIIDDITSYVNSSSIINGSDFIAVVLTSDDMDPKEQLKNGISAIDLGDCPDIIREHYNISKDEKLIILNMESKNQEIQENKNDTTDTDYSFKLGKKVQLEIFDSSGRKLDLSVCTKDITVMKYIGDIDQINIESAMNLASQGIDIFNASDNFFNDICTPINNNDGKDIILIDRRKDIFQNISFCQDGCVYSGMNYDLMTANCLCNSSYLYTGEEKKIISDLDNNQKETVNFKTITKSFISNLFDFNFEVLACYNLSFNLKILINNIGFYCLGLMLLLQVLFCILFMIKKLKPIKYFMLIFKEEKLNKIKKTSIDNNESSKNKLNDIKEKKVIKQNKNQNSIKKYNQKKSKEILNNKNEKNNLNFMENDKSNNSDNNGKKIFSDNENNLRDYSLKSKHKENDNSNLDLLNLKFPIEKKHKIKKKNKIKKKLINTCDFTPIINIKTHCLNINTINKEVN